MIAGLPRRRERHIPRAFWIGSSKGSRAIWLGWREIRSVASVVSVRKPLQSEVRRLQRVRSRYGRLAAAFGSSATDGGEPERAGTPQPVPRLLNWSIAVRWSSFWSFRCSRKRSSMPSSLSTSIVEGWTVSPRKSRKKSACFSSTSALTPARANSSPAIMPAGPPPTITTSASFIR